MAELDFDVHSSLLSVRFLRSSYLLPKHDGSLHLQELHDHASNDSEYQSLLSTGSDGIPCQEGDLSPSLRKYWGLRNHLIVEDGVILYDCRLFIPTTFHCTILA